MANNIGNINFKTEKAKQRFIKKYTEIISRYGYSTLDTEKEIQKLSRTFQKKASCADAIWGLFNKKVILIAQKHPVKLRPSDR